MRFYRFRRRSAFSSVSNPCIIIRRASICEEITGASIGKKVRELGLVVVISHSIFTNRPLAKVFLPERSQRKESFKNLFSKVSARSIAALHSFMQEVK